MRDDVTPKNGFHSAFLTYRFMRVMGSSRKEALVDAVFEFAVWHVTQWI